MGTHAHTHTHTRAHTHTHAHTHTYTHTRLKIQGPVGGPTNRVQAHAFEARCLTRCIYIYVTCYPVIFSFPLKTLIPQNALISEITSKSRVTSKILFSFMFFMNKKYCKINRC